MKSTLRILPAILAVALCSAATVAGAAATVTFTQPDKYADLPFDRYEQNRVMKDLQAHFDKLAAKLPAGQDLKVDVLDIDLAGREEPGRRGHDLRILRGGADWPIIHLRYSVEAGGKVLKSGEDKVADMNYLFGFNRYSAGESLRYEKKMLDRWFTTTVNPASKVAQSR